MRRANQLDQQKAKAPQASRGGGGGCMEGSAQRQWAVKVCPTNNIKYFVILDCSLFQAFVLWNLTGRCCQTQHRQNSSLLLLPHWSSPPFGINYGLFQSDKLVKWCWFMQKHQERISVVLCLYSTSSPGLHVCWGEKTHTCQVCSSTHVLVYSSLSSKNMGLHCASGDMTLLEFIATSALVHSSKFHNIDEDEAPREST